MKKIPLHYQIFAAIILSIIFGLLLPSYSKYFEWMGDIFLRALKMIAIPLIITSLISGVSQLGSNLSEFRRVGFKTISYYIITSLLAITTGLLLFNIFSPGKGIQLDTLLDKIDTNIENHKSLYDTLIEIVPDNIFVALTTNNMLAIIFFSLLFGVFINSVDKKYTATLSDFFKSAFEVLMKITLFIIKFAPLGVFGLIYKVVSSESDITNYFTELGKFALIVLGGLIIHFLITLPLLLYFIGGVHPFKHIQNMSKALLTAFSTASSNATLPVTIECVEHEAGVTNKISQFTLPIGATINMDGTALYELAVAMFVAQAMGNFDLTLTKQLIMVVTALLASIGTAGVPMASVVAMTIVFAAVGLPVEAIAIIFPVDRILDMFRTTVNVWSDSCAAVIIAKSEGEIVKT
jgi:proton glutamate symport protein